MSRLTYILHPADNIYTALPDYYLFVFGSNQAGRHGKGAALTAHRFFGAVRGVGEGHKGQSYALPTKDRYLHILPLREIRFYVERFLRYARSNPKYAFIVTQVGCGLAMYESKDIAPMFKDAPPNCLLPDTWRDFLPEDAHFVMARASACWLK